MENTLSLILLAVSVVTLVAALYTAIRIKSVLYLLHQPVVKKMSPQLRLKPVKLDEAMGRSRERQGAPSARPEGRDGERRDGGRPEGGRPPREGGERREGRDGDRNRDRRDGDRRDGRPPRDGERREGGRPEGDRAPRADRPEGERREGGRERRDGDRRDGRPPRDGERRDGNRESRPPREFSETRDAAPSVSSASSDYSAPASEAPSSLPARRPLPSFSDAPVERQSSAPSFGETPSGETTFVGSSDDMQHGRRTQLKKKPRFDVEEDETPAA
jgi:hypothetical protein